MVEPRLSDVPEVIWAREEHFGDDETAGDFLGTIEHAAQALRLSHVAICGVPEYVSIGFVGSKQHPLDKLYPHSCQNSDCKRPLKFEELVMAAGNEQLKKEFIGKVFTYLTEHYNFPFEINHEWAEVFGFFEYRQYLKKLWKSPHVEFYCCACHDKLQYKYKDVNGAAVAKSMWLSHLEEFEWIEPTVLGRVEDMLDGLPQMYVDFTPIDDPYGYQETLDQLIDDIAEGTGLSREELFGDEKND